MFRTCQSVNCCGNIVDKRIQNATGVNDFLTGIQGSKIVKIDNLQDRNYQMIKQTK